MDTSTGRLSWQWIFCWCSRPWRTRDRSVIQAVPGLARTVLQARPAARAVIRTSGAMMIVISGSLLVERLAG